MTQINLTPEQADVYRQAKEPVQVTDGQGTIIATLPPPISPEFIAELKRRARESTRRYSSEQVTRHMKALAAIWKREGPFDKQRLSEVLEQIRSEDTP
jgi:hypothetical protein